MEPPQAFTDTKGVRRSFFILLALAIYLLPSSIVRGYEVRYAEQFYKLYHSNFYSYPSDYNENIWYLERALTSDFANPLNALARVDNPDEWERYRYLFSMHVNLELVRQYRLIAAEYDKRTAFFYNAPWKDQNLESLEFAESYYNAALYYWDEALRWSSMAWELRFIELERANHWADLNYRIEHYDLDYGEIIEMDLERLRGVREAYQEMDSETY